MTASSTETIRERVAGIEVMPAIPAVFLPLLKLLGSSAEAKVDEVVRLVSYDNTIAAQCLRVAGSPLFGLAQPPKSIKGAVLSLGLRRVETILLTCCLGQAFPAKKWVLDPVLFGDIHWDARWYAESSARSWPVPMRRRPTWLGCCMI
jgi:HD-like signal output (HDOD) protein